MRTLRAYLLLAALLVPGFAAAQLEQDLKAAFLYRFLSFVEWPDSAFPRPESPIVIGAMGADDVLASLRDATAGRVAQARPIAVRRIAEGESLAGVHLLFVGREAAAALPKVAKSPGVLVVADTEGALERGACVNFVRRDGRIRFEVALDSAERQGLRISSRMLAVAVNVRQGNP